MSESIDVTYRPGSPDDAVEAARIIVASLNDLLARQNRPPMAGTGKATSAVLAHLARTDPQRFWVAASDGRLVAFASAWVRSDLCYLSGLFVLPSWQGRGLGSALIERAMRGYASSSRAAVMSSAANPVSNRLYARRGMFALMPVLYLKGTVPTRSTPISLGGLGAAPLSVADIGELRAVDGAVTALDRTADHAWLLGEAGRCGWLFRSHGTATGYAYLGGDGTEGDDAIGPVATVRAEDQEAVLRFLLAQAAERGAATATVVVPGHNTRAQRLLWQAGFGFEGATGLFGCTQPFGRFDRYLFAGDALM